MPRLRFAPSPTGHLHIGGVRTALFNWLYARGKGGQFLLRIEDTDTERSLSTYTDDILACMKWLGLTWDEEIVYQSARLSKHRDIAESFVSRGQAYYCTCSEADVEKMRETALAQGRKPQYDRRCRERGLQKADVTHQSHVIRVKSPLEGKVGFQDLIRGPIEFDLKDIDDFVLVRSNGAPTYNLSVVCDDVEMKVSHIVRGDDHINNTPKQILIYQAMGATIPSFAHLAMILGPDKKKLSKRHGDVSANVYRRDGYLPEAVLNFLVRLGWSHGDQEIFSIEEMQKFFSFENVQTSAAVFNLEKLNWLNGHYIRETSADRLQNILAEDFSSFFPGNAHGVLTSELGKAVIALHQPKVKTLKEMAEMLSPLFRSEIPQVNVQELKWKGGAEGRVKILEAIEAFLQQWDLRKGSQATAQEVEDTLKILCEKYTIKLGELAAPMRLGVTGRSVSAGLFELIAVMPWSQVEQRLREIVKSIRNHQT